MALPNPSPSVRVLVRPPPSSASATAPPLSAASPAPVSAATALTSTPPLPAPSPPPPPDGVVVVGFVGITPSIDASHLINRILDGNVFGSGNLDKSLLPSRPELGEQGEEWFRHRRISYHHDKEKGMVFLKFSSSSSPLSLLCSSQTNKGEGGAASALEECEADNLRGMLFMFSVCHVIIFLQEGLRFDTQILKRFRMLQNAKHALEPLIRSKVAPASSNTPPNLPLSTAARISSVSPPNRRGVVTSRHGSSICLMSGSGSNSSVLPGQCAPVILFVLIDDLLDGSNPLFYPEDSVDPSSITPISSVGGLSKPTLSLKSSGPVVVLARPASKVEGSFKKKLQSSLETQLRFLIKRCRILVGFEHSLRSAAGVSTLPLFLLDASKVVAILDRSMLHGGESLDFITNLIDDALNSKNALDIFSLEKHCQNLNNEDVQAIKDFLYRQAETLRGRGGLPSNTPSGSVAGVGMVAAAAAAAAASAAAGKPLIAPELPSLEYWLSQSNLILDLLLSVEDSFADEDGKLVNLSRKNPANEAQDNQNSSYHSKAIAAAISCLERSKDLNFKFSISWCQRTLPVAKEVYLNELPPFYPTALHRTHLERALHAFTSMVKGPAAQTFARKLEEECTAIWESGRQLCDTVSLTGKPCMHQRHDEGKQHSSGFVFLHACACGRSRRFRDDPFGFESANITFSCFANCENLLPTVIVPGGSRVESLFQNSWRLMRIAGAKYYKPSKGLLQTGFSSAEKYLSKWVICLQKHKEVNSPPFIIAGKSSSTNEMPDTKFSSSIGEEVKQNSADQFQREAKPEKSENFRKKPEVAPINDSSISFGKGLPSFPMKKPFSEVVAGTSNLDPFPVLQQKKPSKVIAEKSVRKLGAADQTGHQVSVSDNWEGPQRTEHIPAQESVARLATNGEINGNPFLQIGSNVVPVNISGEKILKDDCLKQIVVHVGFEHECPCGHRFLLSLDHLKELEPKSLVDEFHSSVDGSERLSEMKNGLYDPNLIGSVSVLNNVKKTSRSTETSKYNGQQTNVTLLSRSDLERFDSGNGFPLPPGHKKKLDRNTLQLRLDDGGSAFSLLNRKLPVYMNCPYCRNSAMKDQQIKFADSISQLQRIFIVTPQFPTVLGTCPVIQFEDSCLPPSIQNHEQQSQFSLGCQVILPPESFLTLKLPFVYGVQMEDGSLQPIKYLQDKPELTAWLVEGTTLQVVSIGDEDDETIQQVRG